MHGNKFRYLRFMRLQKARTNALTRDITVNVLHSFLPGNRADLQL